MLGVGPLHGDMASWGSIERNLGSGPKELSGPCFPFLCKQFGAILEGVVTFLCLSLDIGKKKSMFSCVSLDIWKEGRDFFYSRENSACSISDSLTF